jgi:Ca-activated chloride channel homolog
MNMKTQIRLNWQLFIITLFLVTIGLSSCSGPSRSENPMASRKDKSKMAEEGEIPPPPPPPPADGDQPKDNFNTESYDKIVENQFVSSLKNPLSTFSVDVDRASYANVRRYLNNNTLPPPDAVRIEEMVNYFDYTYPLPTGNVPFSINLELATCPWNTEHQIISIGLKGKEIDVKNVPSNNLVFLLDVSGSMDEPTNCLYLSNRLKY